MYWLVMSGNLMDWLVGSVNPKDWLIPKIDCIIYTSLQYNTATEGCVSNDYFRHSRQTSYLIRCMAHPWKLLNNIVSLIYTTVPANSSKLQLSIRFTPNRCLDVRQDLYPTWRDEGSGESIELHRILTPAGTWSRYLWVHSSNHCNDYTTAAHCGVYTQCCTPVCVTHIHVYNAVCTVVHIVFIYVYILCNYVYILYNIIHNYTCMCAYIYFTCTYIHIYVRILYILRVYIYTHVCSYIYFIYLY